MTVDEFREIVNSMTEREYSELKRRFGTELARTDFVRDFARHPEWDRNLSQLLDVPTESYRQQALSRSTSINVMDLQDHAASRFTLMLGLSIAATVISIVAVAIVLLHQWWPK